MLVTLITLVLNVPGPTPCATVHLMKNVDRSVAPVIHRTLLSARGPESGKAFRDSFAIQANQTASDNFVLRWGDDVQVAERDAQAIVEAFEYAWNLQIGEMEFPAPYGTDDYRFNIYIGDSGNGAPPSHGAAGYYTRDMQGWPFIVLSPETLWDLDYTRTTIAHEFFHAVQDAAATYGYEPEEGAWYFEATAEWMTGETYPDSQLLGGFLFGYALLAQLPVDFFDYPDEGILQEYHQYGAFILPRFLTEQVADWTLIRDSWLQTNGSKDPLFVLDRLLQQRWDTKLSDAFGQFAAHNVAWDYLRGELYSAHITAYKDWFDTGTLVVDDVKREGHEGFVDAPADTLPQRYGYNIVRLSDSAEGDIHIQFQGDAYGSQGSLADFRVTAVVESEGSVAYIPLSLDSRNQGSSSPFSVASGDTVSLVVATPGLPGRDGPFSGETFAYRYHFSMNDDATEHTDTAEDPAGPQVPGSSGLAIGTNETKQTQGGCNSAGTASSSLLWALLLTGLILRSRFKPWRIDVQTQR